MCLINSKKLKHTEPITCYKLVEKNKLNNYFTVFRDMRMELNKTYEIPSTSLNPVGKQKQISINAFHSFVSLDSLKQYIKLFMEYTIEDYSETEIKKFAILECVIPTDSKYTFKGTFDSEFSDEVDCSSYASQKIIPIKEIPIE